MSDAVTLTVTHAFACPAERVFNTWLDPDWLGRWMFGPAVRDEHIVRLGLEPRVGGRFSFVVNRQGTEIDHVGEYLEIDRPRLLVFTWGTRDALPATSRVIVELADRPGGCDLTLTHTMGAAWGPYADKAAASWRKMLGHLTTALASSSP